MQKQYLENWAIFICACMYGIRKLMKKEYKTEHIEKLYQQALSSQQFQNNKFQKPKEIVVLNVPTLNVSEDVLQIFRREQNKGYINPTYHYSVSGGAFRFSYKNKKNISCDINDCVVSKNVLESQVRNNDSLFGISPPQYQSFKAHLRKFTRVTMLGTMVFNIDRLQFVFQPSFIAKNIAEIIQYYREQQSQNKFYIYCLSLAVVGSIIYKTPAIFSYLKNIWRKITGAPRQNDMQRQEISANPMHRLKCYDCENRLADMVLECGHLVQCSVCHQLAKLRNLDIICRQCRKKSNKGLKIYIA